MKLVVPKASRGLLFPRLVVVELNDFDVERLLPSLFYLVATRGRQRGRRVNDMKDPAGFISALALHERMHGFDDETGRRLLDRWIRASVVRTGRAGRAKTEEQIEYVLPLTLMSYKADPPIATRLRNVHIFLYTELCRALESVGARPSAQAALNALFFGAFGSGVEAGGEPTFDGHYDGETEIDLHALLSLLYLDGFKIAPASRQLTSTETGTGIPAMPGAAREIAIDLVWFLVAHSAKMPTQGLTTHLKALINFEMFVYTLKLFYATNALVRTGVLPAAMSEAAEFSIPEIYVDFTRDRGSPGDDLARACVERDIEELRLYFESSLTLRTIDRFIQQIPSLRDRIAGLPTPAYLRALIGLREDPMVEARAQMELEAIRNESDAANTGDAAREDLSAFLAEQERYAQGNSLALAVRLLGTAQTTKGVGNMMRWFWGTGGLRESFGLLAGNQRGARNWRYAMSDDLLSTLVHLAFVDDPIGQLTAVTIRPRIRLSEFLQFLYERFGLLVDRPPTFMDNATYRAAAHDNLQALRQRLRQMGFFEALSDDFDAQYLRNPLAVANAPV